MKNDNLSSYTLTWEIPLASHNIQMPEYMNHCRKKCIVRRKPLNTFKNFFIKFRKKVNVSCAMTDGADKTLYQKKILSCRCFSKVQYTKSLIFDTIHIFRHLFFVCCINMYISPRMKNKLTNRSVKVQLN